MHVRQCGSAAEFLEATESYRGADPVQTNVIGSVATSVAIGTREFDAYWWWVIDDGAHVVGAAMRTAPFGMQVGPMTTACASALGDAVRSLDAGCPWVMGPNDAVLAVAAQLTPAGAPAPATSHRQLLQTIDALEIPNVPGAIRRATVDDLATIHEWLEAFSAEVEPHHARTSDRDRAAQAESVSAGRLHLWVDDGEVVSLAGHAQPVAAPGGTVERVGPVYTPSAHRRHGYAAAVTAGVTDLLLRTGATVMLFTDANNPTSNGVYARLGYRVVAEFVRVDLVPAS